MLTYIINDFIIIWSIFLNIFWLINIFFKLNYFNSYISILKVDKVKLNKNLIKPDYLNYFFKLNILILIFNFFNFFFLKGFSCTFFFDNLRLDNFNLFLIITVIFILLLYYFYLILFYVIFK